jgi:lipopolysaccharide transport system permease protein
VDFLLAFAVLLGMMAWYGIAPTIAILTLPLFVVLAVATALSVGLWLSALNVQYRDVQYTMPFLTQFWFFVTPIVYSLTLLPAWAQVAAGLNPMAGVVQAFRWALLGEAPSFGPMLIVSVAVVLVLLVSGAWYFRRTERTFADLV